MSVKNVKSISKSSRNYNRQELRELEKPKYSGTDEATMTSSWPHSTVMLLLKDSLLSGTSCFNSNEETYNQNPKCEVTVHEADDSQLPGIESEPQSTLPSSITSTPEVSAPRNKTLRQDIESIIKKN